MCGIVGFVSKQREVNDIELQEMCDSITLRGPDSGDIWFDNSVGLGHRRLSIIDLETGKQPMSLNDERVVIVFNGEIYNFLELKSQLIELGYTFNTTSDTEVILVGYKEYGIDFLLEKLEGMFAFALYDLDLEKVFLVRDKFGEKPLYYINNEKGIYFASEIKALEKLIDTSNIDIVALNYFLALSYIPAPYTIYRDVKKVKAAHYIIVDLNGEFNTVKYYDLQKVLSNNKKEYDLESAKNKLEALLKDSIEKRMISDVPIGAFLSGGIDSSIVSTLMAKISSEPINTFSIGFKVKEYDESNRAKLIANQIKSNHKVYYLDYKDVVKIIDEIILHYDEPFGDSSAIPSYYVAKLASKDVKVVLTGDAADELFAGYEKYLANYYIKKYQKLPSFLKVIFKGSVNLIPHNKFTNSILRRVKKVIDNSTLSDFDLHYNMMCLGFDDKARTSLLNSQFFNSFKDELKQKFDSFNSSEVLDKSLFTDLNIVLEGDMLAKVDRACMKNSLEARVPFLDSKIVEFAFSIPTDLKIKKRNKKYILKETFKSILPKETIDYRKKGFGVPVDYWFRNELKESISNLLNESFIKEQGIFNYEYIQKLLKDHIEGKENHKGKLWNLYVFQKWYVKKIM